MSTVQALLAELEERGIELRAEGWTLTVRPRDRVDDELLERLKAAKPDLLVALTGCYSCTQCRRFAFSEPTTCYWCRTTPVVPA